MYIVIYYSGPLKEDRKLSEIFWDYEEACVFAKDCDGDVYAMCKVTNGWPDEH